MREGESEREKERKREREIVTIIVVTIVIVEVEGRWRRDWKIFQISKESKFNLVDKIASILPY